MVQPDDLERGMLVTVLSGAKMKLRYSDDVGYHYIDSEYGQQHKGVPMKVRAVNLPYVVTRTLDKDQTKLVFDVRKVRFTRVSMEYVQAINEPQPPRGPRPSSMAP